MLRPPLLITLKIAARCGSRNAARPLCQRARAADGYVELALDVRSARAVPAVDALG